MSKNTVGITVSTQVQHKTSLQETLNLISEDKFTEARFKFIGEKESFRATAYDDGRGFLTVGYGFNLSITSAQTEFDNAFQNDPEFISGTMTFAKVKSGDYALTPTQGRTLFDYNINIRSQEIDDLGYDTISLEDYQRLAIESLYFNGGSAIITGKLKTYLSSQPQDLVKAQTEIVENSNPKLMRDGVTPRTLVHGLANRRLEEGALFANNIDLQLPDSEFWDVIGWARMAITKEVDPNGGSIDKSTSLVVTVQGPVPSLTLPSTIPPKTENSPAEGTPWNMHYAMRQGDVVTTIKDGSTSTQTVLGTTQNDLLTRTDNQRKREDIELTDGFYGWDGNDTTQGGTGDDHHIGGKGDDRLTDQGGNDSYYFTFDEGHDIIDDADSIGKFFFNGVEINGLLIPQRAGDQTIIPGKWFYDLDGTLLLFTRVDEARNPMPTNGAHMLVTIDENIDNPNNSILIKNFNFIVGSFSFQMPTTDITASPCALGIYPLASCDVYGTQGDDFMMLSTAQGEMVQRSAYAYGGNDIISNPVANNVIIAGGGNDVLVCNPPMPMPTPPDVPPVFMRVCGHSGGQGADTFVLKSHPYTSQNLMQDIYSISDFNPQEGDKIDLGSFTAITSFSGINIQSWPEGGGSKIIVGTTEIQLVGVQPGQLGAQHFVFYSPTYQAPETLSQTPQMRIGTNSDDTLTVTTPGSRVWGLRGRDTVNVYSALADIWGGDGPDHVLMYHHQVQQQTAKRDTEEDEKPVTTFHDFENGNPEELVELHGYGIKSADELDFRPSANNGTSLYLPDRQVDFPHVRYGNISREQFKFSDPTAPSNPSPQTNGTAIALGVAFSGGLVLLVVLGILAYKYHEPFRRKTRELWDKAADSTVGHAIGRVKDSAMAVIHRSLHPQQPGQAPVVVVVDGEDIEMGSVTASRSRSSSASSSRSESSSEDVAPEKDMSPEARQGRRLERIEGFAAKVLAERLPAIKDKFTVTHDEENVVVSINTENSTHESTGKPIVTYTPALYTLKARTFLEEHSGEGVKWHSDTAQHHITLPIRFAEELGRKKNLTNLEALLAARQSSQSAQIHSV